MKTMRKLILLPLLLLIYSTGFSQIQYTVSTIAGDSAGKGDTAGFVNGYGSAVRFNVPAGVAVDTMGNIYVADAQNNAIRKIAQSGIVSTLAGDTVAGFLDGAASVALFNMPYGVCADDSGNVYVADTYNNRIRKISAKTGMVTTVAGNDSAGYRNGAGSTALFNLPLGVAIDSAYNLYVTDYGNNVIRKISAAGIVTTLAGNDTIGYRNGLDSTAEFYGVAGIALDKKANVYVTEYKNNSVREISGGIVTTIAGYDTLGADTFNASTAPGYVNGYHDTTRFDSPIGIAVDDTGNVFISDEYNNVIREVRAATQMVSTIAGSSALGYKNGLYDTAEFYAPIGLALYKQKGIFYVGDNGNNVIRGIYPPGVTGIKPIVKPIKGITVYPTPCNDNLMIASAPDGPATLFDITGRVVWSTEHLKAPYTLSTAGISPGMYFLRAGEAAQVSVVKVVVER